MKLLSYLAFVACLEGLSFSAIVFFLNPHKLLNRLGSINGALFAWWCFCLIFVYGSGDLSLALLFDKLSYPAVLTLTPVLAWYLLRMAEVSNRVIAGVLLPACAVVAVVGYEYVVSGFPRAAFQPGPWGNVGIPASDQTWGNVSDLVATGLSLFSFAMLTYRAMRTRSWRLKRLILFTLMGIGVAVGGYAVLNEVTQSLGVPSLIFLPSAAIVALNSWVIHECRFLQPDLPLESHLAEALTEPALLLDKDAKVVGANQAARQRLFPRGQVAVGREFGLLLDDPEAFHPQWTAAKARDTQVATLSTSHGPLRLAPHYDRFGDFIGAVALFSSSPPPAELQDLSDREAEVLNLLAAGHGNQAIADHLFISRDTVKSHVHSILAKTGAKSRQELLRFGGRAR